MPVLDVLEERYIKLYLHAVYKVRELVAILYHSPSESDGKTI
jgi:hypothetical protein